MMQHPFFPKNLDLPDYIPPTLTVYEILVTFFGGIFGIVVLCSLLFIFKSLTLGERLSIVWFTICGFIHTFFEGYFVVFHKSIVSDNSFFGQAWKEYALSDSRYLTQDPTVLVIETLTAFIEGPLCFLLIYAIVTKQQGFRHVLQIIISFGQLYGCILYYLTSYLEGFKHSHPSPLYFYGYFVGMNLPWIYFPAHFLYESFQFINATPGKIKFI